MPTLNVTTLDGDVKAITAQPGDTMMNVLQDHGLVEGTCGGVASCGTCHIYFNDESKAGARTEDEGYMLEGIEEFVDVQKGSRLSCQIRLGPDHDGVEIEIAPEV